MAYGSMVAKDFSFILVLGQKLALDNEKDKVQNFVLGVTAIEKRKRVV